MTSDYSNLFGLSDGSTFDTNAGVNLPASSASVPIVTQTTTNGVSGWLTSLVGDVSTLANGAAPLVGSITGTPAKTAAATAAAKSSNDMLYIIGGVVVLVLALFLMRRK